MITRSNPHDCLNGILTLATLILVAGCTTQPTGKDQVKDYIYYPPAPNVARYQYLTSISSNKDFGDYENTFTSFIIGKEESQVNIIKPYGIDLHENKIYICDTIAFAIDVVDLENNNISRFQPQGNGRLGKPINISVDDDGKRYVADTAWGMILIYDKDGRYLDSIGTKGETKPTDVVVAGDKLYMTELNQRSVLVLDKRTHKELFRIPREGDVPESELFSPVNIAIGPQGKIYVSDLGGFNIKVFSPDGEFLQTVGGVGTQVGGMVRPKGIAVDKEGRFYVVDAATEVVQVFNPEGNLLLYFGEPSGSDTGLVLPAKVRIDYDHIEQFSDFIAPDFEVEYLILVTNQYGPRKVSVFGFGYRKSDSDTTGE